MFALSSTCARSYAGATKGAIQHDSNTSWRQKWVMMWHYGETPISNKSDLMTAYDMVGLAMIFFTGETRWQSRCPPAPSQCGARGVPP